MVGTAARPVSIRVAVAVSKGFFEYLCNGATTYVITLLLTLICRVYHNTTQSFKQEYLWGTIHEWYSMTPLYWIVIPEYPVNQIFPWKHGQWATQHQMDIKEDNYIHVLVKLHELWEALFSISFSGWQFIPFRCILHASHDILPTCSVLIYWHLFQYQSTWVTYFTFYIFDGLLPMRFFVLSLPCRRQTCIFCDALLHVKSKPFVVINDEWDEVVHSPFI